MRLLRLTAPSLVGLASLAGGAAPAGGQSPTSPPPAPPADSVPRPAPGTFAPGARIRVDAPRLLVNRRVGTLVALRSDSLVFAPDRETRTVAVPRGELRQVDLAVRERSRGAGARKGALVGLGIGGALGATIAIAGAVSESRSDGDEFDGLVGAVTFVTGSVVTLLGTGIGALIGTAAGGSDWRRVPLDAQRWTLAPSRRGVGLAVRF